MREEYEFVARLVSSLPLPGVKGPLYFVSDLHMGDGGPADDFTEARQDAFEWFYEQNPHGIITLGDAIDLWQAPYDAIERAQQHTFLLLTKHPSRYGRWSWPTNCWLGTTVTGRSDLWRLFDLVRALPHGRTWVSFEPLLSCVGALDWPASRTAWAVVGAQTGPGATPCPVERVLTIEWRLEEAGVPVWEKNSLASILDRPLRKERPW